jgi:dihydrofolate reductase
LSLERPAVSLIWAMARNRVIGRDNKLPWHLPADLQHFKRLTLGKPILMGRKTWESLPGVLPGRRHIVVTRQADYIAEGAETAPDLMSAIALAGNVDEIMVVGGATLYAEALPVADRLYMTLVDADIEGDAYFPEFASDDWRVVDESETPADAKNRYALKFLTLERSAGLGQ